MRRIKVVIGVLIISALAVADRSNHPANESNKLTQFHEPSDHFELVRSYPDEVMDIDGYEQAMLQVKADKLSGTRSNGFDLEWRVEGPKNIGARINAMAVPEGKEDTIYIGYALGGIFRTYDGGSTWEDIFKDEERLSIGAIAINPENDNVIYAGTGDRNLVSLYRIGDGVYKSNDGGDSWTNIGLSQGRIISDIDIDPADTNTIYVSAMGLPSVPDTNRGVYKSIDGGATWSHILFINDSSGVNNLVINPDDPNILYASGWTRVRTNQASIVSGSGSKIFKSIDGGASWFELTNGLPGAGSGRTGIAMFTPNPDTLYALYVGANSQLEGVYRSFDGGANWTTTNTFAMSSALGGFGWYFSGIYVNPYDYEDVFVEGIQLWRTTNGGASWATADPNWWLYDVHADKHCMAFLGPNKFLLGTDGGLYRTEDNTANWSKIENNPTNEFYRVAHSHLRPNRYYGGLQDNGTTGGIYTMANWPRIYGGDGFQVRFHPTDSNSFYAETQNGNIVHTNNGGFSFNGVNVPWFSERRNWDTPYMLSHHDPGTMYGGSYRVYVDASTPFGAWTPISGDLTDGNIFGNSHHTISALDESPVNEDHLYVGTSDANVWRTEDGGTNWDSIHTGLPNRYVTDVKASPTWDSVVYVSHSGYKYNDYIPHLHKSIDNGDTWIDISSDLPTAAINDILIYPGHEDSVIFVGTDGGVYGTINGGTDWERVGTNMPMVATFDVEVDTVNNRLIAGTFGRSLMTYPLDSLVSVPVDTNTTPPLLAYLDVMGINCIGAGDGSIDLTVSSGVAPYSFAWSNGATTEDLSGLAPGYYSVTITDNESQTLVLGDTVLSNPIYPPPIIGALTGPTSVQAWISYNYSVPATGGSVFQWWATGGSVTSSTSNAATILWNAGPQGEIVVKETDENGCISQDTFSVDILFVGLSDPDLPKVKIYPNPASDQLIIEHSSTIVASRIIDQNGRLVKTVGAIYNRMELNVSDYSKGQYFFEYRSGEVNQVVPFVVE